jgi:hypothetical protein
MTKEDIYKMVRESELGFLLGDNWMLHHEFEYFAKLIAKHERNEIIQILDDSTGYVQMDLIRERGQA